MNSIEKYCATVRGGGEKWVKNERRRTILIH